MLNYNFYLVPQNSFRQKYQPAQNSFQQKYQSPQNSHNKTRLLKQNILHIGITDLRSSLSLQVGRRRFKDYKTTRRAMPMNYGRTESKKCNENTLTIKRKKLSIHIYTSLYALYNQHLSFAFRQSHHSLSR